MKVMHELCTTLDNLWFPAHLLDLLHHADQLQESSNSEGNELQVSVLRIPVLAEKFLGRLCLFQIFCPIFIQALQTKISLKTLVFTYSKYLLM
jgi:hypothetical protein